MDVISIPVHNRVHWDLFFKKISNVKMLFYIVPTLVQRCHGQQKCTTCTRYVYFWYVILIYRRHNSPSPSTELLAWSWIFWIMLTYSHLRETSKEGQRPITIWVKFYSSFLTHRHLQKIVWSQKQNELNMNKLESLFQFFQMFLWYWYR